MASRRAINRGDNRTANSQHLPTFEHYSRKTLDRLISAVDGQDYTAACATLAELTDNLNYVGLPDLVIQLNDRLAASARAMQEADPANWAWCLSSLGTALSRAGRFDEAMGAADSMLGLGRSLNDEDIESTALQNLGVISYYASRTDEAYRLYKLALEMKTRIGDDRGRAQIENNLASMAIEDGNFGEARTLLASSLSIKRRLRNREELLSVYMTSGNLAVAEDDYREARKWFRKALRIAENTSDPEDVALSHLNLGNVLLELGDAEEALCHYRAGLDIAERQRLLHPEEMLRKALAVAYNRQARYLDALEQFLALARIETRLGQRFDEAMAYHDAAVVSIHAADIDGGLAHYDRAIRRFHQAGSVEWEARSLWEKASALAQAERTDGVATALRRSIRLLRNSSFPDVLADAYSVGVGVLFRTGQVDRALTMFREEMAFLRGFGAPAYRACRLKDTAQILLDYGRPRRAAVLLAECVSIYREIGNSTLERLTRSDLAMARVECGHLVRAKQDYRDLIVQAERDNDRALRLLALTNLAEAERRDGNGAVAVELGRQCIELAEQLNDVDSFALIFNNLGLAYEDAEDVQSARECFRRSLRYARRHYDAVAEARALMSLGNLELIGKRFERALIWYDQAVGVVENATTSLVVDLHESRLMCLTALERDEEAMNAADRAIGAADRLGLYARAEEIARRAALASLKRGNVEKCADALVASLSYAFRRGLAASLKNLAVWLLLMRDSTQTTYNAGSLHSALVDALNRVAPHDVAPVLEMLAAISNALDEQG